MIEFGARSPAPLPAPVPVLHVVRCPDEHEEKAGRLRRLVALLDAKLQAPTAATFAAEREAETVLCHLMEFEGARFRRRFAAGSLLGITLAGVSASSTIDAAALLHNWKCEALRWIDGAAS